MGSADRSRRCLSYFLSWRNEQQLSATTTTKSLARVLRRQGVLPTGSLEMASHAHTVSDTFQAFSPVKPTSYCRTVHYTRQTIPSVVL